MPIPTAIELMVSVSLAINDEPGVPTPNGAGDFWHAEWIAARQLDGLDEPQAAVQATQAVAAGIRLEPDRFRVEVAELALPAPAAAAWG